MSGVEIKATIGACQKGCCTWFENFDPDSSMTLEAVLLRRISRKLGRPPRAGETVIITIRPGRSSPRELEGVA